MRRRFATLTRMRHWPIALLILALIAAGALAWRLHSPSYANYPMRQGPLVAFGDSLVQGVGATEGHDFVSLLGESLGEPIENLGVSGDTTAQGLARIDDALTLHPRMAIILLGGNDYLRRVPKETTFKNLRTIIEKFQADGALTVVLGVRGGLLTDSYASDYAALARDTRSVYVSDVLEHLLGNKAYMYDQIHPNDAGHAIIAQRVFAAVRPLFK